MQQHYRKDLPIQSGSLSLSQVARLYLQLDALSQEHGANTIAALVKPDAQSAEEFESWKQETLASAFKASVTIIGADGSTLHGDDADIFASTALPETITLIYISNVHGFQTRMGNRPPNAFELTFDFSNHKIMSAANAVSSPTNNSSKLLVEGNSNAWVEGVAGLVRDFVSTRRNRRSWLHRDHIYDLGLLVVGIPWVLYVNWRLSPFVDASLTSRSEVLGVGGYVYLTLFSLWMYRFAFDYARWAFPKLELQENKTAKNSHRAIWSVVMLGLIVEFIASVIM